MSDRVLILGQGKIGTAVLKLMNNLNVPCDIVDVPQQKHFNEETIKCTINCTPAAYNYGIMSLNANIPFFDISGDYDKATKLRFHKNAHLSMQGLGLAPGLVNVLAHRGNKEIKNCDDIEICCGGVPQNKDINCFGYFPTWNIDGIVKNYTMPAQIKHNFQIMKYLPVEYPSTNIVINDQEYERILTYGGIDDTINLPVRRIAYFTLRYPGHFNKIRDILRLKDGKEILRYVMSGLQPYGTDKVVVSVKVSNKNKQTFVKQFEIFDKNNLSSMQFITAASAISMMLALYDEANNKFYDQLNYDTLTEDEVYSKFLDYMNKLEASFE